MTDLPPEEALSTLFLLLTTLSPLADPSPEGWTDSQANARFRQISIPSLAFFSQFLVRLSKFTGISTVGEALDLLSLLDSPDQFPEQASFRVLRRLVQHCRVLPGYVLLDQGPKTVPPDTSLDDQQVNQLLGRLFHPRGQRNAAS